MKLIFVLVSEYFKSKLDPCTLKVFSVIFLFCSKFACLKYRIPCANSFDQRI